MKMLKCARCGKVKPAPRKQVYCSHKCHIAANLHKYAEWGGAGGRASGIKRRIERDKRSPDYREGYRKGYEAGWRAARNRDGYRRGFQAGRRAGWREALGEKEVA